MNLRTPDESSKTNDIAKAKLEVARAERALNDGVREVSLVGREGVKQALSVVKPALIAAVAVGGVVWIVTLVRRPRQISFERAGGPEKKSIVREALRTLALSLATAAARRIADSLVSSGKEDHSIPARQSAPPHEVSER